MSEAERKRLAVLSRVRDGEISVAEAAGLLGIGERQAWRLKRRYVSEGDGGLVHRLRGRPSNRKTDDAVRSAVLALYRAKYAGGPVKRDIPKYGKRLIRNVPFSGLAPVHWRVMQQAASAGAEPLIDKRAMQRTTHTTNG